MRRVITAIISTTHSRNKSIHNESHDVSFFSVQLVGSDPVAAVVARSTHIIRASLLTVLVSLILPSS